MGAKEGTGSRGDSAPIASNSHLYYSHNLSPFRLHGNYGVTDITTYVPPLTLQELKKRPIPFAILLNKSKSHKAPGSAVGPHRQLIASPRGPSRREKSLCFGTGTSKYSSSATAQRADAGCFRTQLSGDPDSVCQPHTRHTLMDLKPVWILLVLGASAASRTSSQARGKGIDSPAEGWDLATFLNNYVQLQGFNSVHFLRDSNGLNREIRSLNLKHFPRFELLENRGRNRLYTSEPKSAYIRHISYSYVRRREMVQYSSCLKYKRLSTSVPWEQWWSFGYRHFLRAQKEAYVALSSLADVSQVVDRQLQPSGESHSENVIVIFARLFTDSDFQILSAVLNEKRFQSLHWLFLCLAPCWPRLGYVGFPLDNMAVVAEVSSLRPGAEVAFWDVYQPAPHLPQRASVVSRWLLRDLLCPDCPGNATSAAGLPGREEEGDGGGGVALGFPREPWARRTNLTGLVVRCTALPTVDIIRKFHTLSCLRTFSALLTPTCRTPRRRVKISGIYGELWDALRDILNFTQRCTRPPDGGWGALRNGSWTGMIGELVKGEADVAVAPLDKTYIRSLVVDYPHPLSLEGYVIVIKRPQGSSSTWNSYLREFQPSSWLVLCAVLAALTVVLTFLGRLSPDETAMSAGDAVLVTIAALSQTGYILENL
nr:uncharacterized protein LOC113822671 [Penaeus vannamei]